MIRGLAVGTVNNETVRPYLREEMRMGFFLSAILGVTGCIRAAIVSIRIRCPFVTILSFFYSQFHLLNFLSLLDAIVLDSTCRDTGHHFFSRYDCCD